MIFSGVVKQMKICLTENERPQTIFRYQNLIEAFLTSEQPHMIVLKTHSQRLSNDTAMSFQETLTNIIRGLGLHEI